MKILIAANPDSTHTRKWVQALHARGSEVVLFSLTQFDVAFYEGMAGVRWYCMKDASSLAKRENKFRKLSYLSSVGKLKKILKAEQPDILHAHYASSYGFVAALSGFHPLIVSVWGSDIFEFPRGSMIARHMIRYTLKKADTVLSTSNVMAEETRKYTSKPIQITPFGIDTKVFDNNGARLFFSREDLIIGTIKTLEPVYGQETLLRSFAQLKNIFPALSLKLLIVGDGSLRKPLETLANELGISHELLFTGFVDHTHIVDYFSSIDIFAVPSLQESFGVSALEASACRLPVVASNVGGLPEVVQEGVTGFLTEPGNADLLTEALSKLIKDAPLRKSMGVKGRLFVKAVYEWDLCVEGMFMVYRGLMKK